MRAVTLARRLLAFPLVSVKRVRFEPKPLGGQVFVIEVAVRGCSRCSRCGRKCPRYDRLAPRRWRDLDFGAHEVELEATLARVDCKRCGKVVEQVSWAAAKARFTYNFEEQVGWMAQRLDKTAISELMRISWRAVGRIVERVVDRRRESIDWTKVTAIAVDELSFRKGHRYLTMVSDLESGRILWTKGKRPTAQPTDRAA